MRATVSKDAAKVGPPGEQARAYLPEGIEPIGTLRAVAPTVCAVLDVGVPMNAEEEPLDEVVETLAGAERLAHIVVDALGVATWKCHQNVSGYINRLAKVRQVELQSVLPAIAPVNFSTIATGASPKTHGVSNREQALNLDTTFARLAAAGKASSVCGRAISTAGILLAAHSSNPGVAGSSTDKEVMDLFVARCAEGIDYILAQLLDIDDAGHLDGPFGLRTHQAMGRTNFRLKNMLEAAAEGGYAVMLHGDHGQHPIEPDEDAPAAHKGGHSGYRQEDVRVPFFYLTNEELRGAMGN